MSIAIIRIEPPKDIPGPLHKFSNVTPCPLMSRTRILSIANAKPVGEMSEIAHSVYEVSSWSRNTWMK